VILGSRALGFIENFISKNVQVQPNGVDLTIGELYGFIEAGVLDFDNSLRKLPRTERLLPENGRYKLNPGSYLIRYREIVKVPLDHVAIVLPRSSLLRMGATIFTALYDAGYQGRAVGLLAVFNPYGIVLTENARIAQIIFIKAEKVERGYSGTYQYEGLEESK